MSKLIVFSGLDGAGKSTQIDFLKSKLDKQKKKCFVFWSRGGYTPGFQFLKNSIRFFFKNKLPKPGLTSQRKTALSKPIIRRIWLSIAILDLIFYYSFYLRIKFFLGNNIICDRYLIDTQIDFKLAYPNERFEKWFLWKILIYTALKPDYHFVLTISINESKKRSLKKNEPFPDSIEILAKRLECYNEYSDANNKTHFIWCEKSVKAIKEEINKNLL